MKKYGFVVLAAIAAAFVSLSLSSSAEAYPDARIELSVNHQVVYSGDTVTATGTSTVACAQDLTWNHVVRHSASTTTFTATYVAPTVSKVTQIPLTAICRVSEAGAGTSAPTATALHRTVSVTVLPRASASTPAPVGEAGADLPGTGGPSKVVLLSGFVLVLAGATAVSVARRRAEEVELPGRTA